MRGLWPEAIVVFDKAAAGCEAITGLFFVQNRKTQFPNNSVIFAKLSSENSKTQFFRNVKSSSIECSIQKQACLEKSLQNPRNWIIEFDQSRTKATKLLENSVRFFKNSVQFLQNSVQFSKNSVPEMQTEMSKV